ncbi:AC9 transposase [Ceratobasidium theobromae]|uniref:AC9 transposase n=1 Tax=Ceratobasidium theobromae TaxID=1582974 RepID=A0A5N5QEW3_9AGAM|nr:AC9 transposase [Ceratobasidium theobromae]
MAIGRDLQIALGNGRMLISRTQLRVQARREISQYGFSSANIAEQFVGFLAQVDAESLSGSQRLFAPLTSFLTFGIGASTYHITDAGKSFALIQGVVLDGLPLTFGEDEGMKQLFKSLDPQLTLPSQKTMRRDLNKLYSALSERVALIIKEQVSRMSITIDIWSSTNSSYSFAGVLVTFIDKAWKLQEFVVDVVYSAGEIGEAPIGREIFRSLSYKNGIRNMVANVTDNASNNRAVNKAITKRIEHTPDRRPNVNGTMVTCICHAIHRIYSAILSSLGATDPGDECDSDGSYAIAKAFGFDKKVEDIEEVQEEGEQTGSGDLLEDLLLSQGESGDDLSDIEAHLGKPMAIRNKINNGMQHPESSICLSPVEKVHAIALHCTATPLRRKKMDAFIQPNYPKMLAVIRSMRVRWNSVLSEVRRAILLRLAFDNWVNTLDVGRTSKEQRIAQAVKDKWAISSGEWAMLEELDLVLEPFEEATLSFSQSKKVHLPEVLPTYAQLRAELHKSRDRLIKTYQPNYDPYGLLNAISGGGGRMLHPGVQLQYFQNESVWGGLQQRAQTLVEHLFETYKTEAAPRGSSKGSKKSRDTSASQSWSDRLLDLTSSSAAFEEELTRYFGNFYRYHRSTDVLKWWMAHEIDFPILSRIARDFFANPATNVSVEHMFSRCRWIMTDHHGMPIEAARRFMTCHKWLQADLGDN